VEGKKRKKKVEKANFLMFKEATRFSPIKPILIKTLKMDKNGKKTSIF